jgi:hypothetical protein
MLFSVAGFQTSTVKKKNIEKKALRDYIYRYR